MWLPWASSQHGSLGAVRFLLLWLDSPKSEHCRTARQKLMPSYELASHILYSIGHSIHRSDQIQRSGGMNSTAQWENGLCIQEGKDGSHLGDKLIHLAYLWAK